MGEMYEYICASVHLNCVVYTYGHVQTYTSVYELVSMKMNIVYSLPLSLYVCARVRMRIPSHMLSEAAPRERRILWA